MKAEGRMNEIINALQEYDNGDKEAVYKIILKMMPLIKKLSYKTRSFMEKEDSIQEFSIVIITRIPKLERGRCEGEYTEYLRGALEYKFKELCSRQPAKHMSIENTNVLKDISETNTLNELEVENDILSYIENLPDKQKKKGLIFKMYMIDRVQLVTIARKLEVSRQYVSKVVKEMARDFLKRDIGVRKEGGRK